VAGVSDSSAEPSERSPAGRTDLQPRLDPTHLAVARFPAGWQAAGPLPGAGPEGGSGFCAVVQSEDEVTVVCAEQVLADGALGADAPLSAEHGWRRITFAGPLPWELVGFLADVANRLADAQIPFTSLSGFTTDHVLVRAAQADLAVAVLRGEEPPDQRPGTNP
jgi:hypothetical protein